MQKNFDKFRVFLPFTPEINVLFCETTFQKPIVELSSSGPLRAGKQLRGPNLDTLAFVSYGLLFLLGNVFFFGGEGGEGGGGRN